MKCFRKQSKLMGSAFELGIVEQDEKKANELLSLGITEIKRIENLLSEFLPESTTSLINKQSGRQKIKIEIEVYDLLFRCQKISELTQGFFDITVGPLKKLY